MTSIELNRDIVFISQDTYKSFIKELTSGSILEIRKTYFS